MKYPGPLERFFHPLNISSLLCLLACLCVHVPWSPCSQRRPEVPPFYHAGPEDPSHTSRFAGRSSYLLSHLTSCCRAAVGGNDIATQTRESFVKWEGKRKEAERSGRRWRMKFLLFTIEVSAWVLWNLSWEKKKPTQQKSFSQWPVIVEFWCQLVWATMSSPLIKHYSTYFWTETF